MATTPESLSPAAAAVEDDWEEARGLLYEAYNELQGLAAELGGAAAPAPAVVVVGHQTDGKSALVEALMGFQFNHVGGGTKTRRPVALHLRFNPRCHVPRCRLLAGSGAGDDEDEEAGVAGRAMPLADIQAYIEAENMRLENDPSQFSEKEIIIRIEYKHCPNLTIIDTPGLILPAPGRKNRVLQSQACAVETLVRAKIKHKETIILCLEDCSDWSNATTRRVVMQVDPDLARTVLVSTKLDTKILQFARASDVEVFLHPPTCVLDGSLLGDYPFFTSVPSGRVGSCHEAVFRSNEDFKKAISLRELEDVASLEDKLGRGLTKEEKNRIGEHRGATRKLLEVNQEISDLDEAKMKEKARLFHDSFLSKLSLLLKGMVVAPPDRFGETLINERINGGTFTGSENFLIPNKLMPNAGMRLYGGAQYHRAMAEFRLVVGSIKCPPITREEIVNACGVEDIHDGTNYSRTACVLAVAKARDTFEPYLHQLGFRLLYIMKRLIPISAFLLERVKAAFDRFAESTEQSCRERCMEDLVSTTRYVTWSLHNKNRAGLRHFFDSFVAQEQLSVNTLTAHSTGLHEQSSGFHDNKQDRPKGDFKSSNSSESNSPTLASETRLVDLLDSTLWNRRLAPSSERLVYALVHQIFHGIKEHFLVTTELKYYSTPPLSLPRKPWWLAPRIGHRQERGVVDDMTGGDKDHRGGGGKETFLRSLDRVPSGLHIDADFPSDDDDDDDDEEVRVSFASTMGDHKMYSFRHHQAAVLEEEEEDDDDDDFSKYDMDEDMSGAARPAKPITRRRSDGCLAARDGGSSGKPPPSPSVRRVRSLPARHAGCDDASLVEKFRNAMAKRDLPTAAVPPTTPPPAAAAAAAAPVDKGRTDGGGGKDRDDASKNQESSKEVAVVAAPKDAPASNTQTGVQLGLEEIEKFIGNTPIVKHLMRRGQSQHHSGQLASPSGGAPPKAEKPAGGKKKGGWLKNIKSVAIGFIDSSGNSKSTTSTTTSSAGANATSSSSSSASSSERLKVHQSGKSCKELTGLYMCQEIMAHEGSIWSIKFSTDGRWLASAGEDHVVRIWQVVEANSPACLPNDGHSGPLPPHPPGAAPADGTSSSSTPALSQLSKKSVKGKSGRDTLPEHLVVPDKVFALADQPACVLEGHQDDVLDLTWSKSDQLLSSSMDKTVRLWDTTTKACLKVFAHNDYVTCIQFNPVDDRFFISGSLDAKVRLWSIPDRQVIDWTDLNEMGAIIGSHKGSCRFYKTTDCKLDQEAQIDIETKKRKSQAKKITGFQFAPGNPSEVLVTSADSQIRVFDGVTMVQKFRGFKNTSSQISAAYTSDGRYVVCPSEDSHVYLWRAARGAPPAAAAIGSIGGIGMKPKTWCTIRSFENFYCKDVSAAVPWPLAPSSGAGGDGSTSGSSPSRRQGGVSCTDDVCSMPAKSGELGSAGTPLTHSGQLGSPAPGGGKGGGAGADGNAWGLVVVTASLQGEIRVYQNFGMPFRIRGQGNLFY
uniref:Dynamin-type G domain-containing protein n=2 Tax=Oryza meridionalis TaxID=40149 RepID=A0A0E0FA45_9ORYZ